MWHTCTSQPVLWQANTAGDPRQTLLAVFLAYHPRATEWLSAVATRRTWCVAAWEPHA